jgi:hypothetical protein
MNRQTTNNDVCEPVEVKDPKTGLKKIAYLCKQPIVNRARHYKENKLHFWTDLGLVAIIAVLVTTLISLWIFNSLRHQNLVDFNVTYNTESLVNGQRVVFNITYQNTSKKQLISDAEVLVRFPDGLLDVVITDNRYDKATSTVFLGNLEPGQGGTFNIEGLMLSDVGSPEKFVFVLNYFNDLGQPQQEFTAREFIVESSIIDLTLQAPEKIIIGSQFPSTITITNKAEYDYAHLKLRFDYPGNYTSDDGLLVSLENIIPQETLIKESTGVIHDSTPGVYPLTVTLLQEFNGTDYVLNKATQTTSLEFSKVRPSLSTQATSIQPGGNESVTLTIENNETFTLSDISLSFVVRGDFTNKNYLDLTYGNASENGSVSFSEIPPLAPGEVYTMPLSIQALRSIYITDATQEQNITVSAQLSFVPQGASNAIFVTAPPVSLPIDSTLTISGNALFYSPTSGDQLGVGAVPPQVGQYTSYWAILSLQNGVNQLNNVTVRADIPAGVEFTDLYNVTLGSPVRYLASQQQVEWFLAELPAYAGVIGAAPQARIQLGIFPTPSQAGQVLPLLQNVTVSGIDARTGARITTSGNTITTAIFSDPALNAVAE